MPTSSTDPRATNIHKAAWQEMMRSKNILAILLFVGIAGDFLLVSLVGAFDISILLFSWAPLIGWVFYLLARARERFWKSFAKELGWTYTSGASLDDEEALIFEEGHSQKIGHVVSGEYNGTPARIFEYRFTRGHGKHQTTYYYTAFGFRFAGHFPHCYLNRLNAGYDISHKGERIPLPYTFEKRFHLYGPREYEIEILEIFTPDVLAFFLDESWEFDIELVDQELLVFWRERVNTREELIETFGKSKKLVNRMAPALHSAGFEPIGDYPYIMGE